MSSMCSFLLKQAPQNQTHEAVLQRVVRARASPCLNHPACMPQNKSKNPGSGVWGLRSGV
eukprot:2092421-Rhodomonas_salina.4